MEIIWLVHSGGCSEYRDLQRGRKEATNCNFLSNYFRNKSITVRDSLSLTNSSSNSLSNNSLTYAQVISGQSGNPVSNSIPDLCSTIKNCFEKFKSLIKLFIYLLNKVILKLLNKI